MTPSLPLFRTLAVTAVFALASTVAHAQAFDAVRLYGAAPGQDGGTVGLALIATPKYQGADDSRTLVLPVLDYQWASGWFAGVGNGIGVNLSDTPALQYGVRLTVDPGRKASRSSALHGLGDVDPAAEVGAFFNYALPQGVFMTSSVRRGAGDGGKGLVVDLGAGYSTALAPTWHLGVGTAVTWVNARYMQSFFGVTGAQSATSGLAAYTAGAGARDVRANLALTYSVDPRTSITAAVSSSRLLGDAKNSPLTRKRSAETGILAIAYAF